MSFRALGQNGRPLQMGAGAKWGSGKPISGQGVRPQGKTGGTRKWAP
jgi:hypothetical protein